MRKTRVMRVPLDSWLYLMNKSFREVKGRDHSDEFIQQMKNEYEWHDKEHGGHMVFEYGYGNWSIEEMKRILDEQGLTYTEVEPVEEIEIGL